MSNIYEYKPLIVAFIHRNLGGVLPPTVNVEHYTDYDALPCEVREPIEGYSTHWVFSALGKSLFVDAHWLPSFITLLETFEPKHIQSAIGMIENPSDMTLRLLPYVPVTEEETLYKDEQAIGKNIEQVDKKLQSLINRVNQDIDFINKRIEHASHWYNSDKEKVKTDEIYLGFNTRYAGGRTAFFLTFTRIPANLKVGQSRQRSLLPMTEDQEYMLFDCPTLSLDKDATCREEINEGLQRVNTAIQEYCTAIDQWESQMLSEYGRAQIDAVLIPLIVTHHVHEFSWFGGKGLVLTDYDENDLNSEVCSAVIDEVTRDLFTHLSNIPIPKDSQIAHYAIDHDTLFIYGRDADGKISDQMVDGRYLFSTQYEIRYSKSFLDIFKQHLKTVKNPAVFTQIGKITLK